MTLFIAIAIFLTLSVTAALHLYWAAGGYWPAQSKDALVQTVVGGKGMRQMPPAWLTVLVGVAIFLAGLLPLLWVTSAGQILPTALLKIAVVTLFAIFTLRGIASYTRFFRRLHGEEPFASLDKRYFGPLCLLIGAGMGVILLQMWGL